MPLMKTVTTSGLRTRHTTILKWIEAGEEVKITKRGKAVARIVPEKQPAKEMSARSVLKGGKVKLLYLSDGQKAALFDE